MIMVFIAFILYIFYLLNPTYPPIPEIGRGLPSNIEQADAEFRRRVANRYGQKLLEVELARDLEKQGFLLDRLQRRAFYVRGNFPCDLTWGIHWQAMNGLVTKTNAVYFATCP
jgi:hypothetical protein